MKPFSFLGATALISLTCLASTKVLAQVLAPGTAIQGAPVNGTTVMPGAPTGPLGQLKSGAFGQFALNDNWSALGESPFGIGGVLPYGLRLQKNGQFGLFNLVSEGNAESLIIGIDQRQNASMRFRFISDQQTNQFTDILTLTPDNSLFPVPSATITSPSRANSAEKLLDLRVSDAFGGGLSFFNGTTVNGQFQPAIGGFSSNNESSAITIVGNVSADVTSSSGIAVPAVSVIGNNFGAFPSTGLTRRPIFAVQNQTFGGSATVNPISVFEVRPGGQVVASGDFVGNNFFISSDERFKSDIKPMSDALSTIRKMNGRTYAFKQKDFPTHNFPEGRSDGFIAQELQKVMPEAVVKQPDGYLAVNYSAVIPLLVEAVKQLDAKQNETAQLQEQLGTLQKQVSDLQAAVNKITGQTGSSTGETKLDPSQFSLGQNVPNPTSASTRIDYFLPTGVNGATITIYSQQGKLVKTFANLTSGQPQTVELPAGTLPAGIYIYKLSINKAEVITKRLQVNP
ncbi:tail fiber domain-containing protein [Hymenobacter sp.]|uniref:tail fiber domain-containing protein n=1 Tax=Hymenobacter sp. TaxID=1898978 RepID=UPI00286C89A5|nr:tail fiber domain-containing protein [Hymenobacter sp.]